METDFRFKDGVAAMRAASVRRMACWMWLELQSRGMRRLIFVISSGERVGVVTEAIAMAASSLLEDVA